MTKPASVTSQPRWVSRWGLNGSARASGCFIGTAVTGAVLGLLVLPRLAAGAGAVHSVETFMEEADRGRVHRLVVVLDVDQ